MGPPCTARKADGFSQGFSSFLQAGNRSRNLPASASFTRLRPLRCRRCAPIYLATHAAVNPREDLLCEPLSPQALQIVGLGVVRGSCLIKDRPGVRAQGAGADVRRVPREQAGIRPQ